MISYEVYQEGVVSVFKELLMSAENDEFPEGILGFTTYLRNKEAIQCVHDMKSLLKDEYDDLLGLVNNNDDSLYDVIKKDYESKKSDSVTIGSLLVPFYGLECDYIDIFKSVITLWAFEKISKHEMMEFCLANYNLAMLRKNTLVKVLRGMSTLDQMITSVGLKLENAKIDLDDIKGLDDTDGLNNLLKGL